MRTAVTMMTIAATLAVGGSTAAADANHYGEAGRDHRRPVVPDLNWVDCGDGLQCATAEVPLDYDHPGGRQISLALARVTAGDPAHRVGSLFVNDGGPGNSVLDFVHDSRNVLPSAVQAQFDIVGFDPRGVGQSTPVRCFADTGSQEGFFGALPPFPVTGDDIEQAADARKTSAGAAVSATASSSITSPRRTWPATWTSSGGPSAMNSSPSPATPTAGS